jgi:hypothetical protein
MKQTTGIPKRITVEEFLEAIKNLKDTVFEIRDTGTHSDLF